MPTAKRRQSLRKRRTRTGSPSGRSTRNDYLPASKARKTPRSWGVEKSLFKWIDPVIGDKSFTFARAVDTLKMNEGIKDRRLQVTFHTLRHTYASWHVENGTDLYTVKELLGHSDFKMTARYSHLGENTLQAAVKRLDSTLQAPGKVVEMVKKGG